MDGRVLHIVPRASRQWGGQSKAAIDVVSELLDAEVLAELASTSGNGDDLTLVDSLDRRHAVHLFPRTFPARFSNSAGLQDWLRHSITGYALVEIHGIFDFTSVRAASCCRRMGIPYLVRPHGALDPFDLRKKSSLKRLLGPVLIRPMLEGSSGMVLTSQEESLRLVTYGASPTRFVVPLPVRVPPGTTDRQTARRSLGIPDDSFVVLFLSRVDYKKGLDILIPAIAQVHRKLPDLLLVIAGGGEESFVQSVREDIKAHHLEGATRFLGWVGGKEKETAFAAADVFALPSQNENFGIAVVEALHAGLPVVISREVYVWREVIEAGAGIACDRSAADVAKAIEGLAGDASRRNTMSQSARQAARKVFDANTALKQLRAVYDQVLKDGRGLP